MVESLNKITDHPKINISQNEYERIQENKRIYSNKFPEIEYLNSNGITQTREYKSISTAKQMAKKLSKLVFNDGCSISVDDDDANEFLQSIFNKTKFRKNFGEELEAGYAISGLALRPYVDQNSGEIKISYCSADSFYPLHSNTNDISEAAIVTTDQVSEGKDIIYYTLIEFHEWDQGEYVITNELYKSKQSGEVGIKVPLSTLEKYENLSPETRIQGLSRPLFVYIKLAGKNNINLGSPLGLGVADNAKTQLKDINDKYDQFMWEIEEARRKIIASDQFFTVKYDNDGKPTQYLDNRTSVFQKLRTDMDDLEIKEFVPSLRADEFIKSINFILRIAENQVGFSQGTFSFDGKSVKTATEIVSENSETYTTRADNVQLVEEGMKELITSIFELATFYQLYKGKNEFGVNIDFDDGVFESKEQKLEYNTKATTAGLKSKLSAIMSLNGCTEEEAIKELDQINQETRNQSPDYQQTMAEVSLLGREE